MRHACELCGTELGPRDRVCKVCGHNVGATATPSAQGKDAGAASSVSDSVTPNTYLVMPQAPAPGQMRRGGIGPLGKCVLAAALTGVVCWGGYALWMRGPGGSLAFDWHNRAGNAAYERGDFNEADTQYSEMIALRPRRVDGYLLRAINDYKAGRFPQAIRDNTAALALSPPIMSRATLLYNRAEAYNNRGEWNKAVADYTSAEQAYQQASADPDGYDQDKERIPRWQADARRGRARANLRLKNYAQTIADYSANISAGFIFPEEYGMRATAQEGLGHDAQAIAGYGKAICVDPGYIYGYQKLSLLVTRTHRYEQAVAAYRQATEAHPENVIGWGSLGCYEHMAGHLPAAIAADERALSLDPNQYWIRYNLGLSYAVAGDTARSRQAYDAALKGPNQALRVDSLKEIRKALVQHPNSTALLAASRQVEAAVAAAPHTPAAAAQSTPQSAPPVDPAFESRLAADTALHGYAIRPPAGYTRKQDESVNLSGNHTVDLWQGPVRPDATAPKLQIEIINDDGRMTGQAGPKQRMQSYLGELAGNHTQLKTSAITPCTLGLRTFMKATWSGVGAKTGKQFNGIVYTACTTGEYICIVAHDSAPDSAASLLLLEASIRTFRK